MPLIYLYHGDLYFGPAVNNQTLLVYVFLFQTAHKVPVHNCVSCNAIIDAEQQENHPCHPDICCICQEVNSNILSFAKPIFHLEQVKMSFAQENGS